MTETRTAKIAKIAEINVTTPETTTITVPLWLTPMQVATLWHLSRMTIYRRIAAGQIPVRRDGRRVLINAQELMAVIEAEAIGIEEQ